ncbi:hypothetical protein A4X13_0g8758, partial [Tilletia indica]
IQANSYSDGKRRTARSLASTATTGQQDGGRLGREDGQISFVKTRTRDGHVDDNRLWEFDGRHLKGQDQGVKMESKAPEITAIISRCVKARTRQRQDGQMPAEGQDLQAMSARPQQTAEPSAGASRREVGMVR